MAEVLGVIAGGTGLAAFAGQIASNVLKLKSYLDQIKDAPEDIRSLVDEIEVLELLSSQIVDDHASNPHAEALLRSNATLHCIDLYKRGVERLRRVADEIATDFEKFKPSRRRWVSVKMIWKRERIEKYRSELASTVRLLTLSHQIYTSSLIHLQSDVITERITNLMHRDLKTISTFSTPSQPVHIPVCTSVVPIPRREGLSKSRHMPWLRWNICSLLLARAWDFEICKSQQGWQFSFSTYAVVPRDSLVVKYILEKNVKGLQRLFAAGEASPSTIFPLFEGYEGLYLSLLGLATGHGSGFETCQLLVQQGADPAFTVDQFGDTLTIFMEIGASHLDSDESYKVAELLASNSEVTYEKLRNYSGGDAAFSAVLKYLDVPIETVAVDLRYDLTISLALSGYLDSPTILYTVLGCRPDLHMARYSMDEGHRWIYAGTTLLHAAAYKLGSLFTDSRPLYDDSESLQEWAPVIKELVIAGADIHAIAQEKDPRDGCTHFLTPLIYIFRGYGSRPYLKLKCHNNQTALMHWIAILRDAGVDLMKYGREEKSVWLEANVAQESWIYQYNRRELLLPLGQRLIGFKYGPTPKDWVFWHSEPTDEFAGDFWMLVEDKGEKEEKEEKKEKDVMPGTFPS